MRRYRLTIDGRTYDVEIEDPRSRPVVARVNGERFLVDVESEGLRDAAPRRSTVAASTTDNAPLPLPSPAGDSVSTKTISAPLPGLVVAVTAEAGATVQRGDPLVTIEAMKMFNVIRSPRAGTIDTVHVVERKNVAQGDPLVTFGG